MTKGTGKTENAIEAEGIPVRKVVHSDSAQIPHPYSQTPNGTIFSTTPGGTRIIYDRTFLLGLRNSPHARSPPKGLKIIPGITKNEDGKIIEEDESGPLLEDDDGIPRRSAHPVLGRDVSTGAKDDTQFQMEM